MITVLILVVILNLLGISMGPTTHYHVDTATAQVLYQAPFWIQPGVIDKTLFTQEVINQIYSQTQEQRPFFILFTLQEQTQNTTIVLNQQTQATLQPFIEVGVRGIHKETSKYPVTIHPHTQATLLVEAYYENK